MSPWRDVGRYGTLGIELTLTVCLGFFGGNWLDKRFGTHYWVWVGFVFGAYAGFRNVFKAAKEMQARLDREDREDPKRYERFDDDHDDDSYGPS